MADEKSIHQSPAKKKKQVKSTIYLPYCFAASICQFLYPNFLCTYFSKISATPLSGCIPETGPLMLCSALLSMRSQPQVVFKLFKVDSKFWCAFCVQTEVGQNHVM